MSSGCDCIRSCASTRRSEIGSQFATGVFGPPFGQLKLSTSKEYCMAAIANIAISDGTTSTTFTPQSKDGDLVVWVNSGASYQLDKKLVADAKKTKATRSNRNVDYHLSVPYVLTDLNDQKTYKAGYINIKLNVPKDMPSGSIARLRNYAMNLPSNDIIIDQIDNGFNPY